MRALTPALLSAAVVGSACSDSRGSIEVPLGDARSAITVNLSKDGAVHIRAFTAGGGALNISPGEENDQLYVVPYGCSLERLGLTAGDIETALDELRPPIPKTHRRILRAEIPADGAVDFTELAIMPPALTELRLLKDNVSDSCCPAHILDGSVNLTFGACSTEYCAVAVTKNPDTCALELDPSPCAELIGALDILSAQVEGEGAISVSVPASCSPVAPRPYTAASFDCAGSNSCPIDVHLPPKEPRFRVDTATVVPGAPRFGDQILQPTLDDARLGYLSEMIALNGELIVASFGRGSVPVENISEYCSGAPPPMKLQFFDDDNLAEISTATIAPCSLVLAPDPSSEGFLSAHLAGRALVVARHDRRGRELSRSAPIPIAGDAIPRALIAGARAPHPIYLSIGPDPALMFVLASPAELRLVETIPHGPSALLNTTTEGELAWIEDEVLRWIDDPLRPVQLDGALGEAAHSLALDTVVVPAMGERGGAYVVERSDRGGAALPITAPFESDAGFSSAAVWPSDQRLMILGGLEVRNTIPGARTAATIALFSPDDRTFVSGAQRIGFGPVRKLTPTALGSVYGILPWTGALVRIRPAQ